MARRKKTTDAVEILRRRFLEDKPKRQKSVEAEYDNSCIASAIYQLRTNANLTQRQLAERVGTQPSVISRLEDADYGRHSLSMLRRIAAALDSRLEVRLVPNSTSRRSTSKPSQRHRLQPS